MMVQAQEDMGEGSTNPTDPHHTPTIIQPSTSQPQKTKKHRKPKRKVIEVPQPSVPISVADEAVIEEMDDNFIRAATTATSLDAEHDRGNIFKTQSKETPNVRSKKDTKCVSAAGEELTAAKHNLELKLFRDAAAAAHIEADDTHQLYTSFITLLKNFDREDLEDLWKIGKAGFSTSKPTNFSDDYLLVTLKTMFEKTDAQDVTWRSQQTEYGQALVKSWKLLTSCGVHIITFTTTMFALLVEKKYLLSRFTLE
nr:hypothetical protein [Tanacetum cinerariifolium]